MDLTLDENYLDLNGRNTHDYVSAWCNPTNETLTFIQNLTPNEPQILQFEPNASGSGSVIRFNGELKGPKICISVGDYREFLIRSVNGDGSSFKKLKGHVVTKTKHGVIEMMWGDSNIGDSGAKYE